MMAFADNSISRLVYSTWKRERDRDKARIREWKKIIVFFPKSGQFKLSILNGGETKDPTDTHVDGVY